MPGGLPGGDGWLVLAPAESAPLLFPEPAEITMTPVHEAVLDALADGGAVFFRMLHERVAARLAGEPSVTKAPPDTDVAAAIWDLVWAGQLTNDTLGAAADRARQRRPAPQRSPPREPGPAGRAAGTAVRLRAPGHAVADRAAERERPLVAAAPGATDPTLRAHALAQSLLDRYGILTKGAVAAERIPGGFSAVYPVLRAMEDAGRAAAVTSSRGWGRRSSRSPAPWTGCARWPHRPPGRPTRWPRR